MTFVTRYSTSAVMAGFITFSLFLLMQFLLLSNNQPVLDENDGVTFRIIPAPGPDQEIIRKPIERPEVSPPAPDVPKPDIPRDKGGNAGGFPVIVAPPTGNADGILTGNADAVLLAPFTPPYPQRAILAEKEGYALVEFTVTEDGRVINPVLLDEAPTGYGFGAAAMKAIVKFRYEPRVTGDAAVAVYNVREQFIFELPEE